MLCTHLLVADKCSLFFLQIGGRKGFRVDYEALSWRSIKTKNKQASLICKSESLFKQKCAVLLLFPLCSPFDLALQRRS